MARATGKPQDVGSEAYLNRTSQGPTPEDARKDGHIRGRSRRLVKYLGYKYSVNHAELQWLSIRKVMGSG